MYVYLYYVLQCNWSSICYSMIYIIYYKIYIYIYGSKNISWHFWEIRTIYFFVHNIILKKHEWKNCNELATGNSIFLFCRHIFHLFTRFSHHHCFSAVSILNLLLSSVASYFFLCSLLFFCHNSFYIPFISSFVQRVDCVCARFGIYHVYINNTYNVHTLQCWNEHGTTQSCDYSGVISTHLPLPSKSRRWHLTTRTFSISGRW